MKSTTASSSHVPIHLEDLGSTAGSQLDFGEPLLYARMRPEVRALAQEIPVYLVSEEQMDMISPPTKYLEDEAHLDDWIKALEKEGKSGRNKRWQPPTSSLKKKPAVGVYLRGGVSPPKLPKEITAEKAIFICPERVIAWAEAELVPVSVALANVYYHALGHAELDIGSTVGGSLWERIIEESLCNHLSLSQFDTQEEQRWVMRLMATQPPEYRAYKYFWGLSSEFLRPILAVLSHPHSLMILTLNEAMPGLLSMRSRRREVVWGEKAKGNIVRYYLKSYKLHPLYSVPPLIPIPYDKSRRIIAYLVEMPSYMEISLKDMAYPPAELSFVPCEEWRKFKRGDPDTLPQEWWEELAWKMLKFALL